jgi:hypothetical protein
LLFITDLVRVSWLFGWVFHLTTEQAEIEVEEYFYLPKKSVTNQDPAGLLLVMMAIAVVDQYYPTHRQWLELEKELGVSQHY